MSDSNPRPLQISDIITQVSRDPPSANTGPVTLSTDDDEVYQTHATDQGLGTESEELQTQPPASTAQHVAQPRRTERDSLSIQSTKKRSWCARIFCCFCGSAEETVIIQPPAPGTNQATSNTITYGENETEDTISQIDQGYPLLPPYPAEMPRMKTIVLDLDETLVHSSFKPVPNADFIIDIEIEGVHHRVYVRKRPYVDAFLQEVGKLFEVVIFTASLSKYADPLLDLLDTHKVIKHRLFRESCTYYMGNFVKDMTRLGRNIQDAFIIDNSPVAYYFQPENAIAIESWFDDPNDCELIEMIPFLQSLTEVDDVRLHLQDRH